MIICKSRGGDYSVLTKPGVGFCKSVGASNYDDIDGFNDNYDDNFGDFDDNYGYPAYSHHDRFPPWWVFVRNENGGNLSGDKIPPFMMIIINHLTQFNSSH